MTYKILLTGAGFSHNFGLPLANDVWGMVFNNSKIQTSREIRNELLKEYNYEKLYSEILVEEKFSPERDCFLERINIIFNDIFEALTIKAFDSNFGVSYKDIRSFILMIVGKNFDEGFLFTTNQDLLLERIFIENRKGNKGIASPHIGNCLWNFEGNDPKTAPCPLKNTIAVLRNSPYFKGEESFLPTKKKINEDKGRKSGSVPYYKLHGSIGWKKKNIDSTKLPIVMGTNKSKLINSEPLFTEYFNILEQALFNGNSALLVIGYSFSDKHINEKILKGIQEFGLKVHVINPCAIQDFIDDITKKEKLDKNAYILLSKLHGYYQATLKDIFPVEYEEKFPDMTSGYICSQSEIWQQLRDNFFGT